MSNPDFPDDGVLFRPTDVMHTPEGPVTSFDVAYGSDVSRDEAKERIADAHGIDPEAVALGESEMRSTAAGRISVGFSKWRSSWDPHAEREAGKTDETNGRGPAPPADPLMN
jgi:hypothetical protein